MPKTRNQFLQKKYLGLLLTMWAIICCTVSLSAAEKIKVMFINPGISDAKNPTGEFWVSVSEFMRAVAEDLQIDLEILYAERNHILMQQQARDVATRKVLPDYLIVVNEKLAAGTMIDIANRAGMKTLMINNAFVGEQAVQYGAPREKYPYWLGALIPDHRFAGYQIAKLTIERALQAGRKAADGKLHLVAIAGNRATQASIERVEGLQQALAEYPEIALKQIFYAEWSKEKAYELTTGFLKRYPETSVIWSANDPIALGAIEATVAAGKTPGKDVFVGGLNWDPPAIEKIHEGMLVTSVGGHFMIGGWALVMLYDYHHGKDFTEEGVQFQRPFFAALHKDNIQTFLEKFRDRNWRNIDFTRFSKVLNPAITTYNFSFEAILQQDFW